MSIKRNERGEVVSVNGLTTGHHIGTPMQDAKAERPEHNQAYSEEVFTVTRAKNAVEDAQPKPVGGASSWNDLSDKPFYEETTTVGGDTLTWDGNTEGLVSVADMLYKVSDNALNDEQIKACTVTVSNGMSVVVADYWDTLVQVGAATDEMVCVDDFAFFVKKDGATLSAMGFSFPEAGIYVAKAGDVYVNSITIPGSNAFVTTQTVVKPIETKYLPEHLQFGETVAKGDTLTWDGNTEGLETFNLGDETFYRVCKNPPSLDDLKNGFSEFWQNGAGETHFDEYAPEDAEAFKELGFFAGEVLYIIPHDNFAIYEDGELLLAFPKAGVWFFLPQLAPSGITINGYGGFESKTVKPMDEKYMPILTSPSGKKFKLSVDDSGAISATEV